MGRQLRRVPLDFDWPVNQGPWEGFLMPKHLHGINCVHCDGSGSSPAGIELKNRWYGYIPFRPADNGSEPFTVETPAVRAFAERQCRHTPEYYGDSERAIVRNAQRLCDLWNAQWSHHLNQDEVDALVAEGRLHDLTHRWEGHENGGKGWVPTGYHPTAREVNEWSCGGFGHDSINQWIVCRHVLQKLGLPEVCEHCHGEGETWRDAEHKAAHDAWEATEPPEGSGYQIWETVSEGSPISPVFDRPDDLASYMARNWERDGNFDQWMTFIEGPGWSPSMIMRDGEVLTGAAAAASFA